jgi:competence protein ComEC
VTATLAILAAWLVAGTLAGQLAAYYYPSDHISQYAGDSSRLAQVEFRLDDPPRIVTNPFDDRRAVAPKQTALATITRVYTTDGWRNCTGDVLLQITDPHPNLAAGQTVRAIGMLQRPAPAMNPGQFDWAAYYRERRVLASFTVSHAASVKVLSDPGAGWLTAVRLKARRLLAEGFPAERSLDHALLQALLLGDNDPQLRDVQDQFQRTGTAHHLAISGTHVALLGALVWGACRLMMIGPRAAATVGVLFTIGYGLLALPSPPVVRSVVLAGAAGLGVISRRHGAPLQLLAASVVAMLVFHPPDIANAGFQLSFGTVLGLILFTAPTLRAIETVRGWHDPDAVVQRSFAPEPSPLIRAIRWADRWLMTALAAGLVAWMVSMPLIAWHFEQLNPWAIVAGILLAPVVFLALVGGFLKVVLTLLWPALASAWAWLAVWPVQWMRRFVDWLATWPLADVPVPPSPWWLIATFYLLLTAGLISALPDGVRWVLRLGRVAALAFIITPPLQVAVSPPTPAGTTTVTVLAVGAGQCVVVQPPGGRTILIDAGSLSLADPVGKCLGPFLRHARVANIDTLVLSHADYDHVSAAAQVVRSYGVREVLTGDRFAAHAHANDQTRGLLQDLSALNRPPRIVSPGQRIPIGRDTTIEILWPPAEGLPAKLGSNDGSLVLKLTHAGRSMLFPGDIQDGAMRELLKTPKLLKADVLVAMHHGSAEELTQAFVDAVDPSLIVSSNDRTLTGKQRQFERLIGNRPLLRTHDRGAITLRFDDTGVVLAEPFVEP